MLLFLDLLMEVNKRFESIQVTMTKGLIIERKAA